MIDDTIRIELAQYRRCRREYVALCIKARNQINRHIPQSAMWKGSIKILKGRQHFLAALRRRYQITRIVASIDPYDNY